MKTLHVCDFILRFLDILVSKVKLFFLAWICALIVSSSKCVFCVPVFLWLLLMKCE
jgi:hypothetical protein